MILSKEMAKREFPAQLDTLYAMMDFVLERARHLSFSENSFSKLELSLEEALVNIILHGYNDREGNIRIACQERQDGTLVVIVEDEGVPFNLLEKAHELKLSISTSKIGGYGVYFIVELIDEVYYEKVLDGNRLTLVKYPHT